MTLLSTGSALYVAGGKLVTNGCAGAKQWAVDFTFAGYTAETPCSWTAGTPYPVTGAACRDPGDSCAGAAVTRYGPRHDCCPLPETPDVDTATAPADLYYLLSLVLYSDVDCGGTACPEQPYIIACSDLAYEIEQGLVLGECFANPGGAPCEDPPFGSLSARLSFVSGPYCTIEEAAAAWGGP